MKTKIITKNWKNPLVSTEISEITLMWIFYNRKQMDWIILILILPKLIFPNFNAIIVFKMNIQDKVILSERRGKTFDQDTKFCTEILKLLLKILKSLLKILNFVQKYWNYCAVNFICDLNMSEWNSHQPKVIRVISMW